MGNGLGNILGGRRTSYGRGNGSCGEGGLGTIPSYCGLLHRVLVFPSNICVLGLLSLVRHEVGLEGVICHGLVDVQGQGVETSFHGGFDLDLFRDVGLLLPDKFL